MTEYTATVSVNADEYRVYWYVHVVDKNNELVHTRSFTTPEDANDYVDDVNSGLKDW